MKKVLKVIIIFLIIYFDITYVYAENEDVLESQKESLNLSGFIAESQKYAEENLEDINVQELLNSAIKGKVEDEDMVKNIFNIFGNEIKSSIKIMRKYFNNYTNT